VGLVKKHTLRCKWSLESRKSFLQRCIGPRGLRDRAPVAVKLIRSTLQELLKNRTTDIVHDSKCLAVGCDPVMHGALSSIIERHFPKGSLRVLVNYARKRFNDSIRVKMRTKKTRQRLKAKR
jgi:hypothetical protein